MPATHRLIVLGMGVQVGAVKNILLWDEQQDKLILLRSRDLFDGVEFPTDLVAYEEVDVEFNDEGKVTSIIQGVAE